jgi:hypothetical protein
MLFLEPAADGLPVDDASAELLSHRSTRLSAPG